MDDSECEQFQQEECPVLESAEEIILFSPSGIDFTVKLPWQMNICTTSSAMASEG